MKKIISTDNAPKAIGPYSQAVEAGGFLFLSGQIPIVPATGEIVVGDVAIQTEQVLKNIEAVLVASGLSFEDVVKTTVFITDMNDFATINAVYAKAFTVNPPSRSCVQVARLPKDVQVEIETIAAFK